MDIKEMRDKFIKKAVTETINNTALLEIMKEDIRPIREMMTIYSCAIMEIETKLKVLDAEFSLDHDHNPIESIKTRLKSMDGIIKKANKKKMPLKLDVIEKNISDIAGVRVICSFAEDIYIKFQNAY